LTDWYRLFKGRWKCPKCGSQDIIINEHALTGAGFTRLMNWQSYEYVAVTCARCGYTEFYSKQVLGGEREAMKILDLLFGS